MSVIQAIILGALQGVTEFLPVSSSGHLVIAREFMDIAGVPLLFDVLLHVSTLAVVIFVFRRTVGRLFVSLSKLLRGKETDPVDRGMILAIIVATVVTGVLGVAIEHYSPGDYPRLVAVLFVLTAFILFLPRFFGWGKESGIPGLKTGLIVGAAQGLGVFPGISRSGITITASQGAGLSREQAGEFAFLISIPAILGALVLTLKDMDSLGSQIGLVPLIAGMISSLVVGWVSLELLLRLVKNGKLHFFAFYLLPLGVISLIIL